VIDSLKNNKTLNSNILIQLSQIYDTKSNSINVKMPFTQKQENSSDCGIFAIAFITELIVNNFDVDINNLRFEIPLMRKHLSECLDNDKIIPFTKITKMPKMPSKEEKSSVIKLYCTCKMPDIIDNMVKCDNKFCKIKWYHKSCSGCNVHTGKWLCRSCCW
jgi:hypothetical protein